MKTRAALVPMSFAFLALLGGPSVAGGFLADVLIRPISPSAADAVDNANRQLKGAHLQAG